MSSAPKVVLYQNDTGRIPSELFVLNENADGTLDLSRDGKTALVTNCTVSDEPKAGQCGKPFTQKKAAAPAAEVEQAEDADEDDSDVQKKAAAQAAADKKAAANAKK